MKLHHPFILAATLLATSINSHAELHRGLWFWGNTSIPAPVFGDPDVPSPYGSSIVVGDPSAEDESINFFITHGIKRIYGSYQNRPVSEPTTIATWNNKLHAAGISSQILFDGSEVNDPAWMAGLLVKITNRLINFNNALGPDTASKFDAIHLDLEPQGLALWSDPYDKRALLDDLLQAYIDIRTHLDSAGFTDIPMYADLGDFYDKFWDGTEGVGWADAADRDAWYAAVADVLEGISIMSFGKDNFTSIDNATSYERGGAMTGKARVGIQPKVGPGKTWSSLVHYNGAMNQLETAYTSAGATDIENYGFYRHAHSLPTVPSIPGLTVLAEIALNPSTGGGGVIIFHGVPGYLYQIKSSGNLEDWSDLREISTMQLNQTEQLQVPVPMNPGQRFFKVVRSDPPAQR